MLRLATLALVALLTAACPAISAESPKLPAKENFHLFLLIGQSNMAGRGKIEDQDKKTHPRVLMLNKAGQLGQFAERPWSKARQQVDQAHRSLPAKVPYTAFVSSDGLKHKGDEVYFDSASCREFGKRYAEAFLKLQSKASQ